MSWLWRNEDERFAIEELRSVSDRAAATVGAVLVEQRLEEAIRIRFQRDTKIEEELFRSSGPMGSFSAKIRLAFLMNMLSREAYKDLDNLKTIRNRFAHDLAITFETPSIKDRCANFSLVEKHIHEWINRVGFDDVAASTMYAVPPQVYVHNKVQMLAVPRERYIQTAMLFGRAFGAAGLHVKEGQLI
jgi:DNA-binding MltR family transcriptional regulator